MKQKNSSEHMSRANLSLTEHELLIIIVKLLKNCHVADVDYNQIFDTNKAFIQHELHIQNNIEQLQ